MYIDGAFVAVQEERQRGKDKGEGEVESTSSANSEMPVEQIIDAELSVEPKNCTYIDAQVCVCVRVCVCVCVCVCHQAAYALVGGFRKNPVVLTFCFLALKTPTFP